MAYCCRSGACSCIFVVHLEVHCKNGRVSADMGDSCIAALIPEETIAGYDKATAAGTDFIEMDIVSSLLHVKSVQPQLKMGCQVKFEWPCNERVMHAETASLLIFIIAMSRWPPRMVFWCSDMI